MSFIMSLRMSRSFSPMAQSILSLPVRYAIGFQPETIARLCKEHGLVYPGT